MNTIKLLESYEKMYLLRKMEEELVKYYYDNKIMSFVHFYVGQEAVAVGVCENLESNDMVFGNHRSHGHYLAKGGDPGRMVAELLGKSTGCCAGKGGSMHMIDKSVNFMGSTPILGSVVPISAGSALTQKLTNSPNITVAFFGDGAAEEGVVYETINFASLFKLPLLLVVENNYYSVMSKLSDRRGEHYNVEQIVNGLGAKYFFADGNDFFSVYNQTKNAIQHMKSQQQVAVLECSVYRHMAHSAPIRDDKVGYRHQHDSPENRAKNDSVLNLRNKLMEMCDMATIVDLEEKINIVVADAIRFGVNSTFPENAAMYKDVYHE